MKDGGFVEIEFVGRVKDTGEVFDLTDAEIAKKEGVFDPKHKYGPALVIIGAMHVVPGVEEEIKGMAAGEEKEFGVAPEKGFGRRDPQKVQVLSISKFHEQRVNPVPGSFVNIDGRDCRIQSVSGGRVRVDFNHPLAGKDLLYKVKILREVDGTAEKIDALLKYYGLEAETNVEGEKAKIKIKGSNKMVEKLVEDSVKRWIKEIREIEFEKGKPWDTETENPVEEAGNEKENMK